eukprot:5555935-Amphidinium_carterae.1
MSAVTNLEICRNSFEGALPGSGLHAMRGASIFFTYRNSFKGTIPESGIRRMSAVTNFDISINSFEGAVPGSGLQVMRVLSYLSVQANRLAGTLPNIAIAGLGVLIADKNDFEGKMSHAHHAFKNITLPTNRLRK